jgi:Domain of unknown function (DUF4283)
MAAHPTLPADPHLIHRVWLSDENSAKIAEEVKHSLILISDQDVALSDVLPGLQTTFPSLNLWTARYLGNDHYQDQGSEKWRQDMVHAGMITLRQISFKVSTDLSCLYALSNPVKIWIRILNLDYEMRGYQGLVAVTQPFGSLLDLDFNTILRSDLRWARVFIEVVDLSLIPPFLWFEVRCPNGWVSYVKIRYELDVPSRTMGLSPAIQQPVQFKSSSNSMSSGTITPLAIPATIVSVSSLVSSTAVIWIGPKLAYNEGKLCGDVILAP